MKSWKPTLMIPRMPSTRLRNGVSSEPLAAVTASVQPGEAQRPEEQGALVRAPDRGDAVEERQLRMRIRGDVQHREVALDE